MEESKHCLNNPACSGNSSPQSFMLWLLKIDAVIIFHSNHMKRMSNLPILKYSSFYNVWAFCSLSIVDLKVSCSLKLLANSIWFTLLLRALLSFWLELKHIQYFTFNNHDTRLKENASTAKLKKKIKPTGLSLFSSALVLLWINTNSFFYDLKSYNHKVKAYVMLRLHSFPLIFLPHFRNFFHCPSYVNILLEMLIQFFSSKCS